MLAGLDCWAVANGTTEQQNTNTAAPNEYRLSHWSWPGERRSRLQTPRPRRLPPSRRASSPFVCLLLQMGSNNKVALPWDSSFTAPLREEPYALRLGMLPHDLMTFGPTHPGLFSSLLLAYGAVGEGDGGRSKEGGGRGGRALCRGRLPRGAPGGERSSMPRSSMPRSQ